MSDPVYYTAVEFHKVADLNDDGFLDTVEATYDDSGALHKVEIQYGNRHGGTNFTAKARLGDRASNGGVWVESYPDHAARGHMYGEHQASLTLTGNMDGDAEPESLYLGQNAQGEWTADLSMDGISNVSRNQSNVLDSGERFMWFEGGTARDAYNDPDSVTEVRQKRTIVYFQPAAH